MKQAFTKPEKIHEHLSGPQFSNLIVNERANTKSTLARVIHHYYDIFRSSVDHPQGISDKTIIFETQIN